jgi:hypothetical protein
MAHMIKKPITAPKMVLANRFTSDSKIEFPSISQDRQDPPKSADLALGVFGFLFGIKRAKLQQQTYQQPTQRWAAYPLTFPATALPHQETKPLYIPIN